MDKMINVGVFIPVDYSFENRSVGITLQKFTDNYFYFGGKRASVLASATENKLTVAHITDGYKPSSLVTAIKIFSYCTLVIPALIFTVKLILRTLYPVYIDQKVQDQGVKKQASVGQQGNSENVDVDEVIEIEEELAVEEIDEEAQAELNIENWDQLEAPIGISEEIIDKIKPLIDAIHKKENNDEIVWYSQSNTLVFGVKSIQDLVFKMDRMGNDIESRARKISQSEQTCSTHALNYLHIPKTALFTVNNTFILAEKRIPFQQNHYVQKKIYKQLSDEDQNIQMIQQLALFIIETGFSDVEHRNIPIVTIGGFRKIVLIDLEEVSCPITGLFGSQSFPPRTGLIQCLFSVQQISTVYEVIAKKQRMLSDLDSITLERLYSEATKIGKESVEFEEQWHQFHQKQGLIKNPSREIRIASLESLGFVNVDERVSIDRGTKTISLSELILAVIKALNNNISKNIKNNRGWKYAAEYRRLKINFLMEKVGETVLSRYMSPWGYRILETLREKGYLFKVDSVTSTLVNIWA